MPVTEPDRPEETIVEPPAQFMKEGLRVLMTPIPGVTDPDLMTETGFLFQCPPLEEFATEYAFSHSDYDTVREGQFSRAGGRQLRTVSFDTLMVDQGSFAILDQDIDIEEYAAQLVDITEAGSPFLLTVAHELPITGFENWDETLLGPELQMEATLRSLRVSEKAGEGDARYFTCAFVEHREPFAAVHSRKKPRPPRPRFKRYPRTALLTHNGVLRDKKTNQKISHTKNDSPPATLHRLARYYYRDPTLWSHIASHERNQILNWGATDDLEDYFKNVRHTMRWPEKITIPGPPGWGHINARLSRRNRRRNFITEPRDDDD